MRTWQVSQGERGGGYGFSCSLVIFPSLFPCCHCKTYSVPCSRHLLWRVMEDWYSPLVYLINHFIVAIKFPSVRPRVKPQPTNAPSSLVQLEPGTLYHLHQDLLALILPILLGNLKLIYKINT